MKSVRGLSHAPNTQPFMSPSSDKSTFPAFCLVVRCDTRAIEYVRVRDQERVTNAHCAPWVCGFGVAMSGRWDALFDVECRAERGCCDASVARSALSWRWQ